MDIYILKISTSTQANQSPNKRFSRLQLRRRETKDQEATPQTHQAGQPLLTSTPNSAPPLDSLVISTPSFDIGIGDLMDEWFDDELE